MKTPPSDTVTLSLISHTNVGKTTLARTLLRRDIGEVRDQPHVTDVSEAHTMLETPGGTRMTLWDTPGFGDTARLLKRLKSAKNPITWIISQTWDRFRDRPLWCSQQAVRNVQSDADIVLYLVNSAEDPSGAAYVDLEMQILGFIGKPVVLLLNQTGPPRTPAEEADDIARWREHSKKFEVVREALSLDAFARCWVQEAVLLDKIGGLLPEDKRKPFEDIRGVWREQNLEVFSQSMDVVSKQLATAASARIAVGRQSWGKRLRTFLMYSDEAGGGKFSPKERAMSELATRLDDTIRESMNELIVLHGLEGSAVDEIFDRIRSHFASKDPMDGGVAAVLGGFVSGALAGLAADMLAGGLTFFGGAVAGGFIGATGAAGAAMGYNVVRGAKEPTMKWTPEFLTGFVRSALLRYLAVAHFGRGRGEWTQGEAPSFWQDEVAAVVDSHAEEFTKIWSGATPDNTEKIAAQLRPLIESCAQKTLERVTDVRTVFR